MTIEQAYAEGFCKAAEAAGVDPVALYKRAGLASALRSLKLFSAGAATGGVGLGLYGYNKGYNNGFDTVAPLVAKPARDWTVKDVKIKDKVLKRLAELAKRERLPTSK